MQAVIDERADEKQRDALRRVLHGEETQEAKTHWWVFAAMSTKHHPTLYKPISMDIDIKGRTAKVSIPDLLVSTGRPIKPPHGGPDHRVRIAIPDGIEFELAEIGSASSTAKGAISFELSDSYGQWNILRHSGTGVVH